MHAKINIITFAVAVFVSVELSSARSFSKRDLPVTSNDQDTAGNVEDATSTPYSNYTSYADTTDQRYPNGELSILFFFSTQKHITTVCDLKWFLFIFFHKKKTPGTQKSNTPTAPKKVDASGDYSALYPPPPALSLPPFSGIPYPLPLTGTKKHCAPRKHDDGMTVALPSDLYTGRISKCGQKVVVVFEPVAGQPWSGPKNNLTLTVVDAFDSNDKTEIGRTVLLSEKAWKEATGNSIINKFESWPIRWFFIDAAMQQDTAEGTHENSDGEGDGCEWITLKYLPSPTFALNFFLVMSFQLATRQLTTKGQTPTAQLRPATQTVGTVVRPTHTMQSLLINPKVEIPIRAATLVNLTLLRRRTSTPSLKHLRTNVTYFHVEVRNLLSLWVPSLFSEHMHLFWETRFCLVLVSFL